MRFFKYLFIIALFIGFTPLLTSCSDDDDTPSIEGYWYADLQTEPEMVVFKNGKFASILPPMRSNPTLAQMKEWADEALNTHKVKDFGYGYESKDCVEYGTYTISGNKLVLRMLGEDEYDDEAKVSFNGNTMVITWDDDEYTEYTVYQRYTEK